MKARGKRFLSDSYGEGGSISWEVRTCGASVFDSFVDGSIKIRDCSRFVEIDFDCSEYKHIKKRIDKADRLILELNKMKEALLLAEKELAPKKFYY
tara:strand:- start:793 stop:1080 length:288 start_codon:yes stop_codon:yes gene_type:complete